MAKLNLSPVLKQVEITCEVIDTLIRYEALYASQIRERSEINRWCSQRTREITQDLISIAGEQHEHAKLLHAKAASLRNEVNQAPARTTATILIPMFSSSAFTTKVECSDTARC
jgi:hypothetical protein